MKWLHNTNSFTCPSKHWLIPVTLNGYLACSSYFIGTQEIMYEQIKLKTLFGAYIYIPGAKWKQYINEQGKDMAHQMV